MLIASFQTSQSLLSLRNEENRIRVLALEMILTRSQEDRDAHIMEISQRINFVDETITTIQKHLAADREQNEKFGEVMDLLKTFRSNREKQLIMINQGKTDQALDFALTVQNPLYESIQSKMSILEQILSEQNETIREQNEALITRIVS